MKLGSRNFFLGAVVAVSLCLALITLANGQTMPAAKPAPAQAASAAKKAAPLTGAQRRQALRVGSAASPLMAEQAFHNVQVLKGIPAVQFMDIMGFFSASLVETCTFCHSEESCGNWDLYAKDTPIKTTARSMVRMTESINRTYFAGAQVVTCFSCHYGTQDPEPVPSLKLQYAVPVTLEPEVITRSFERAPTPDMVLDKYIAAIGGADKVNALKSYVASGSYEAYSASEQGKVDLYFKAPNQMSRIFHTASGDSTITYDGARGWQAGPDDLTPLPVVALSGADLDGYRVDAQTFFPAAIKSSLTKWVSGVPYNVNDRDVYVIQGMSAGNAVVKLYFDRENGYLLRVQRYIKTMVGYNPYEIDYSDYRDVDGIKTPFHIVILWTDGRSTIQLDKVQWNAPVDASQFAQPKPPKPSPSSAALEIR